MMKNKNSKDKLSYFSKPRLHANVFAWKKQASKSETSRPGIENIQRWEDDGGPVLEIVAPLPQIPQTNTANNDPGF
jgi:hypothetical protein